MNQDTSIYCDDLDWYLTRRDAACGVHSNLSTVVSIIEHGGGKNVKGKPPDLYQGRHAELGPVAPGAFARDRTMLKRWNKLSRESQWVLVVHYVGTEVTAAANGKRMRFPLGVEPTWSKLSAVVLWQAATDSPEAYENALRLAMREESSDDDLRAIKKAETRAHRAVSQAHGEYYAIAKDEPEDFDSYDTDETWRDVMDEAVSRTDVRKDEDGVWRQH